MLPNNLKHPKLDSVPEGRWNGHLHARTPHRHHPPNPARCQRLSCLQWERSPVPRSLLCQPVAEIFYCIVISDAVDQHHNLVYLNHTIGRSRCKERKFIKSRMNHNSWRKSSCVFFTSSTCLPTPHLKFKHNIFFPGCPQHHVAAFLVQDNTVHEINFWQSLL